MPLLDLIHPLVPGMQVYPFRAAAVECRHPAEHVEGGRDPRRRLPAQQRH
ncbi:hypothetical protein [Pseudonocardia xishanensis]